MHTGEHASVAAIAGQLRPKRQMPYVIDVGLDMDVTSSPHDMHNECTSAGYEHGAVDDAYVSVHAPQRRTAAKAGCAPARASAASAHWECATREGFETSTPRPDPLPTDKTKQQKPGS